MVYVSQYVAGGRWKLKRSGQSLGYASFQLASRVAPYLPRPLAYRLADLLGDLFWLQNGRARRAVHQNLTHVFGRPPPSSRVRAVFRHGARNYYDTFIIPTLTAAELLSLVQVQGWDRLDAALQAGRGAIMVGVHLSSVALAAQVIAARGYAVTSVAERVEPPELMDLLTRLRSGGGVRVLPLGSDSIRELLAAIRRNEVIGLVADRDLSGTGVEVEFFGAQTRLPAGAARLAIRTGAPLLSAVAVRVPGNRFEGRIDPPIELEQGADLPESVRRTTRRIAQRFEHHIAAQPEQWTVFQPIWPGAHQHSQRGLS